MTSWISSSPANTELPLVWLLAAPPCPPPIATVRVDVIARPPGTAPKTGRFGPLASRCPPGVALSRLRAAASASCSRSASLRRATSDRLVVVALEALDSDEAYCMRDARPGSNAMPSNPTPSSLRATSLPLRLAGDTLLDPVRDRACGEVVGRATPPPPRRTALGDALLSLPRRPLASRFVRAPWATRRKSWRASRALAASVLRRWSRPVPVASSVMDVALAPEEAWEEEWECAAADSSSDDAMVLWEWNDEWRSTPRP